MVKRSRQESASPEPEADALHTDSPASAPQTPQGEHAVKYIHVDAANASEPKSAVMKCHLPGHKPLEFASYEEYDVHYLKTHVNRCSECNKNFPSELILNLHLAEIHDPINEARKARGEKIYACFAEGCDKKCSEPHKRRMHMVSKHHFPKDYDFTIIKDGIDGRKSMLRSSKNDIHGLHPKKPQTETPKAKAERSSTGNKNAAKSHIILDEDDNTTVNRGSEVVPKEDAMDIVNPTDDDPPADSLSRDVEMKMNESLQPVGLSASKHAIDLPRSAIDKGSQKKGKQKEDRVKAKSGIEDPASASAGNRTTSSQATKDTSDDPMEGLTKSMSSLKFVPQSIRFGRGGRGRGRGGFARG